MANDINVVVLTGRITKDAELKTFNGGSCNTRFSIAVNRKTKKGDSWVDEVSYFECVVWGKTAENLNQYLTKGKQVSVDGELRQNRWEKDGQKYSKVEVFANKVVLLGGNSEGSKPAESKPTNTSYSEPAEDMDSRDFDSDVPF